MIPRKRKTPTPKRKPARFVRSNKGRANAYAKLAHANAMLDEHIAIAKIWKKKMNGESGPKIKREFLEIMASAQKYLRTINQHRAREGKKAILIENIFPPIKRK